MKYLILMAVLLTGCGENDPSLAKNMELTKKQRAKIEERITPFGWVNIEGVSDLVAEVALAGETMYAACGACHGANGGGGVAETERTNRRVYCED